MGLGCGTTMVKYILFVFNFLIALGGIALVTIGSIILAKSGDLNNAWQDGQNPSGAAIALIIFGGIVFLISFFGCCGAIRESYCMTMTYATILFMIFVAQLVVAILVLVYKQDFKDEIMTHIGKIWAKPEENRDAIQGIQKTFNCCGWGELSWGGIVSKFECAATGNIVENDCKALLSDFLSNSGNLLAWVAIGVAGVELVALIFACCLGNNVRNAQRRLNY